MGLDVATSWKFTGKTSAAKNFTKSVAGMSGKMAEANADANAAAIANLYEPGTVVNKVQNVVTETFNELTPGTSE